MKHKYINLKKRKKKFTCTTGCSYHHRHLSLSYHRMMKWNRPIKIRLEYLVIVFNILQVLYVIIPFFRGNSIDDSP